MSSEHPVDVLGRMKIDGVVGLARADEVHIGVDRLLLGKTPLGVGCFGIDD